MTKRHGVFSVAALLLVAALFALAFAACEEEKPAKPAELATTATYDEVFAKFDEIATYCDKNSTDNNKAIGASLSGVRSGLDAMKNLPTYKGTEQAGAATVEQINVLIRQLD